MSSESPNEPTEHSRWPVGQMLMRGTFNTGTRAEKRLVSRSNVVLRTMLAWILIGGAIYRHSPFMRISSLLMVPLFCTYYAWEKRKYFLSLDELPQRIELEGMAWAYSLGVLAALWMAAVGYVISLRYTFDPKVLAWMPLFLFAVVLAAIKGTYRYFATRRY